MTEAHIFQTVNARLDTMEHQMDRVEKLLKAALFALQQVIKKGEDQEELENFQKSIKTRETINTQTPTKSRIPQPKNGNLAQSIHAPTNKNKQNMQQQQ